VVHKVGTDRADDIVQHVFLKAHEHLSGFRAESALYTWLFKIAQNTIMNDEKRSYRTREISTDNKAMYRFISADFTDEVDFQLDLGTAMRHLDEIDQQIISLRFAAGLPFSEISDQLELNESTIKNRLYRCIGKMKPMLEDWYSPEPWPAKELFVMVNILEKRKQREQDNRVMDDILRLLKKNVRRVTDMLNYIPTHKITYEVYPNIEALHQSLGVVDSNIVGNSFTRTGGKQVSTVSPLNPGLCSSYTGVMQSALYLFGSALAQQMNQRLPRWLYEGVGNYVGMARRRQDVIALLAGKLRTDELPTYQEMSAHHGRLFSGNFSRHLRHLISYTMVDFIVTRYGLEAVQRIMREPKASVVFQKDVAELETEWRQFVSDTYLSHSVAVTSAAVSPKGPNELVILMPTAIFATGSARKRVLAEAAIQLDEQLGR
jgi:RNA polymerase sigma-70 factor (ECF subfamily)